MNRKEEAFILGEQNNIKQVKESDEEADIDDLELIKSKLRRLNNE